MKYLLNLVAVACLVTFAGCASTNEASTPNMGAVSETGCSADCDKECCETSPGAVQDEATCPYTGSKDASMGAVGDSDCGACPSSAKDPSLGAVKDDSDCGACPSSGTSCPSSKEM
jgi:hypothetical protein